MYFKKIPVIVFFLIFTTISHSQEEAKQVKQVIKEEGYKRAAPAIVKLITDEGKRIGAGVILGVHKENIGFVLTSYNMVAGRDKVAVILKDFPDPLLGITVEKWIDFDSEIAVIAVKNFPPVENTIRLQIPKEETASEIYTIVGHTPVDDWMPIPQKLTASNDKFLIFNAFEYSGLIGAPVLNEDGNMVGLVINSGVDFQEESNIATAVKSSFIKPIITNWFREVKLKRKWKEKGQGLATWVWAVGGSVVGTGIVTAIAVSGGGEGPRGLPGPPAPPGR